MKLSFKWQKILLLHFFEFSTKNEIEQLAHRFNINAVDKMLDEIGLDIKNNGNCVYIVELVPIFHKYKLPNYLIRTANDLLGVANFISDNLENGCKEIWYYRKQEMHACGRVLFSSSSLSNQTIEIIDGNTVRALETKKYSLYFRADRINWGWGYDVKESYFPDDKKALAQKLLTKVFVELEKQKTKVCDLERFFNDLGLNDFTIDFLLIKDVFYVIDWDTGNDMKVFNYLNTNDFESWNDYYMGE